MAARPHVLREYALLADGYRGVLVGPEGDFAWMCAPRWDSPAVFSSLMGSDCSYEVAPRGRFVWGGYYEDGSLIWVSRWVTGDGGIVECREALALPADPHRAVLLRRVRAVRGPADVAVTLAPGANFGTHGLTDLQRADDGRWHGRTGALRMRWSGAGEADAAHGAPLRLVLRLEPGAAHDLVLELADADLDPALPDAQRMWESTATGWQERLPRFATSIAPRDARHAYAVLAGLTHSSGGMVAAATTGLPERADRGRNYDYRFVWIRDQCFAGQAVAADDAPHPLLDDAVRFVSERLLQDGPDLAPAYTVDGKQVPPESDAGLPGYPGGSDALGNHVRDQFQLDTFGEALLLYAAAARHDRLDTDHWRAATTAVAAVAERWDDVGAGLWELHPRRWTHSRLICAAGLRQLAAAAAPTGDAARWNALADRIVADTATAALHPSGRWQRAVDDERVDAALLLPPVRGAVPAEDPRTVATLRAVRSELTDDGYAYRFRHDRRPLASAEGAFLLCGFVMALAEHHQGDGVAAARWFERNRAACGPPGLFAEEYDIAQRQLRGNIPQAFVHAMLLETSIRLAAPAPRTAT